METWTRWPYATVTPQLLLVERIRDGVPGSRFVRQRGLMLHQGKQGVRYPLAPHEACWRTFADVWRSDSADFWLSDSKGEAPLLVHYREQDSVDELIDRSRLLSFVRHYGPPNLGGADTDQPFHMGLAVTAALLDRLALHWDRPTGPEQLSRRLPDAEAPDAARECVHCAHVFLAQDEPPSLQTYMIETALRHIRQEMPMARCRACGNWIAATRSDRQFCDGACRQAIRAGKALRGRRQSVRS